MAETTSPILIGLDTSQEVFIDGFHGAIVTNGVIKLNCVSAVFDPVSNQSRNVVVLRLVMSAIGFMQSNEFFDLTAKKLLSEGIIVAERADDVTVSEAGSAS